MAGEYGEPWRVDGLACLLRFGRKNSGPWDDCDGDVPDDSDADRIVACVNAMDGLDPAQVRELVRLVGEWSMLNQKHTDARKALDAAEWSADCPKYLALIESEFDLGVAAYRAEQALLAHARSMEGM